MHGREPAYQSLLLVAVCALSTPRRCCSGALNHGRALNPSINSWWPRVSCGCSAGVEQSSSGDNKGLHRYWHVGGRPSLIFSVSSFGWRKSGTVPTDWQLNCQRETCNIICVIFTALHGMHTRSSNVRPSVSLFDCPSNAWILTN